MVFIDWNTTPRMGINEIDNQHHHFIDILNKTEDYVLLPNQDRKQLDAYITDIMEYAGRHFATEEKYFKRYKYPLAAEHINEHAKLLEQAIGFYDRFKKGENIGQEFLLFLRSWLANHLMKHDMKYADYFRQIGATELD
jgi:hemerythrin